MSVRALQQIVRSVPSSTPRRAAGAAPPSTIPARAVPAAPADHLGAHLARAVQSRATARSLQRVVSWHASPPAPAPWYSDVTSRWYTTQGEALIDERTWQIRFFEHVQGGGVGYQAPDDPGDTAWDPQAMFRERMQQASTGNRTLLPLEQKIANWDNTSQRLDTGFGMIGFRRGWGGAPFVQSRAEEYQGEAVKVDYDDICRVLDDRGDRERERLAGDILHQAEGAQVDVTRYDARTQRAAAHLLAITHLAEESSRRTPGSADFARQCLKAIYDGVYTFTQCFNRTNGLYVAAQRGGTRQMRETARGEHPVDDLLGGYTETDNPQ
jgi:hypothetical protein